MDAGLLNLKLVAEPDQKLVRLLVGQAEVDGRLDEARKLIENQVLVGFHIWLLFLLFGRKNAFQRTQPLLKEPFIRSCVLQILFSLDCVFSFHMDDLIDAFPPAGDILPYVMV